MSLRAVAIALSLVVLICGFGYFSQHVAGLPSMIGGAMPLVVFATIVIIALAVNPVAAGCGLRPFGPGELALILAIGVSVCGYTGASYLRYLASAVTLPAYTAQTRPHWQSSAVLAYVPGHLGEVPHGHVLDPHELARRVVAAEDAQAPADAPEPVAAALWRVASSGDRLAWRQVHQARPASTDDARAEVARLLNRALADPAFAGDLAPEHPDRLAVGRRWLQQGLGEVLLPPPRGRGVLLNEGRYDDRLIGGVLFGQGTGQAVSPAEVPWRAWWPVLRLWGGLMLLMMLIAICLCVIVRRQWAEHERLAFPLVRFTELITTRDEHCSLPRVAYSPLFALGFAMVLVHLLNALHDWFPRLPHVPLRLDFSPLRVLFPNASAAWASTGVFEPMIYPTVIAFAFFLPRAVSLTFGITTVVYLIFASQLIAHGVGLGGGAGVGQAPFHQLMNFGAMLGMCAALLYTGRRYYLGVARRAMWPASRADPAPSAVWAFRMLMLLIPLAILHLVNSGLSPLFASLGVGVVLLLWLVNARLVSETGMLRFGNTLVPVTFATALFGIEGVGPTYIIILTMIGVLLATDLWESPMAYIITGLQASKRAAVRTGVVVGAIGVAAILGLALALVASLAVQHGHGVLAHLSQDEHVRSNQGLEYAAVAARELAATGQLVESVQASDILQPGTGVRRGGRP